MRPEGARCAAWASLAALMVLGWQAALVHVQFGGDWSGLFCTGGKLGAAPALAAEHVYLLPGGDGWDGQFYHYIAHDPLLRGDFWKSIDAPRLRYRRILLPALASIVALGHPAVVDWAYRGVVLGFIFLGAWWLARLAVSYGRHPAWCLAFCFLPGTIVSIDRMGVDAALAAFTIAFLLYARKPERSLPVYIVLVLAALARDTGLILIAGWCGWLLWERRIARAAAYLTAALPTLAWYVYVAAHTPPFPYHSVVSIPFAGMLHRLTHPMPYPFAGAAMVTGLDWLALAGLATAIALVCRAFRESGVTPATASMALFVVLMAVCWYPGDWLETYDYGRIFSPLLALVAVRALETRRWVWILPMAMVLPRVGLQAGYWAARAIL